MTIPVTALHVLRLLLQVDSNLSGLQADMRRNALDWKAKAAAQSQPVETLAQWMTDCAAEYQRRLGWITTAQADTTTWSALSAMWAKLGGTAADFNNIVSPMKSVADQLGPADKSNYSAITSVCDQITAAINAPLSLWPE